MEYFLEGTLPANGTVCEVDEQLFPASDIMELQRSYDDYSYDDLALLGAARILAERITPLRF